MKYRYIPVVGQTIKLAKFEAYTFRDLNPWIWFRVIRVHGSKIDVETTDGPVQFFTFDTAEIQPTQSNWREP